jgi:pimeloyl-ACP methyl ester carboxylesterase
MALLKRPDGEIYYELSGHGPPVLLIQGVGVTGEGWRPEIRMLERSFQTLTFDNRGIGRSISCNGSVTIEAMAEDVRALMDTVGWESAHVVGHSMGGVIAQQLALDDPKRVRSLSLLCTFARGKDAARVTPWVLWMTLRTRLGTRRMRRNAFLQLLFPPDYLRAADRDKLAADVAEIIGRDLAYSPPVLIKQVQALSRHDASSRLGQLAGIPTLVVSARHDPIALPKYGRQLAQLIPGANFEEMPSSSHGVIIQEADNISRRIEKFFCTAESLRS